MRPSDRAKTEFAEADPAIDGRIPVFRLAVNLFDLTTEGEESFYIFRAGPRRQGGLAVDQSLKIVENRINAGHAEPTIQRQGKDRIVIQLPGVGKSRRVKDVIGQTAELTFQLLCDAQPTGAGESPRRNALRCR